MRITVVVTTYRKPRELELVLAGYGAQDDHDFDVVVADDGSGEGTARVVEEAARTGLDLTHVWHADRGFRKTEILNRALLDARGDYVIFTDGDCIPRADLVRTHRELARRGRYLSGGYVRLPPGISRTLDLDDVRAGRPFDPRWLRERGHRPGRRVFRLLPPGRLPGLLDRLTPTRASFNGMNSSVAVRPALEVDGFDLDFTYGGLDREFGARLRNLGLRPVQIRHRAVVLHLHHERPYRDREAQERQKRRLAEIERGGRTRAVRGLSSLDRDVETRVTRHGRGRGGTPVGRPRAGPDDAEAEGKRGETSRPSDGPIPEASEEMR
ncbi:MAG: glycosyltransferase [Gemmatimonadota bacterium]